MRTFRHVPDIPCFQAAVQGICSACVWQNAGRCGVSSPALPDVPCSARATHRLWWSWSVPVRLWVSPRCRHCGNRYRAPRCCFRWVSSVPRHSLSGWQCTVPIPLPRTPVWEASCFVRPCCCTFLCAAASRRVPRTVPSPRIPRACISHREPLSARAQGHYPLPTVWSYRHRCNWSRPYRTGAAVSASLWDVCACAVCCWSRTRSRKNIRLRIFPRKGSTWSLSAGSRTPQYLWVPLSVVLPSCLP